MDQSRFLSFQKITEHGSGSDHTAVIVSQTQTFQRRNMKMLQKRFMAQFISKIPGIQSGDRNMHSVFQIVHINTADQKSIVTDNFCRCKLIDLIQKLSRLIHLCNKTVSGGYIRDRDSVMIFHAYNGHEIIIFALVQILHVQVRSRSHHTSDFPLHHSFCLFGIFYLLANGNLIPFFNQSVYVSFRRMERNAAHGRPFLKTAVLSRKSQFQFPGYGNRILKKHLIKISQTVK
ncbi:putative uncharacterized protein [Firmicutes bacterium CAG:646]|nr:putative uncharacterized protein [Firmicutes bacterium CAG:646]